VIDTMVEGVEASSGAAADEEFFEPHQDACTDRSFVLNPHELAELA
jgi:hypothetical protein